MPTTISGSTGVTFPAGGVGNTAGAAVGTTDTQTLTNKTIQGGAITSGTAVASTSGTSIDFTSIPSWVKRITVMFNGLSTNGSAGRQVQLGAGSVQTTGYISVSIRSGGTVSSTSGLVLDAGANSSDATYGILTIALLGSNNWVSSSTFAFNSANAGSSGGTVTLGGTLDRVRITTTNGTDTFDAGSINILYE